MPQRILITNLELEPTILAKGLIQVYFFNPWGFSQQGIVDQIHGILESLPQNGGLEIFFCVRNRFFGNRAKIAFEKVQQSLSHHQVSRITEQELALLLNQASI